MLEIKVSLVPYGDRKGERVIEKFIIYNDGTGSSEFGNYVVEYEGEEVGVVKSHKRSEGALELIRKALNNYLL